ncbi:hypothetical protein LEMLEM_LOCUS1581, partial [Lemmus lemmus]
EEAETVTKKHHESGTERLKEKAIKIGQAFKHLSLWGPLLFKPQYHPWTETIWI